MPVYNTPAAMLERAVQSILDQTFDDFEFLILDDGRTEVSVGDYLAALPRDRRVRLIRRAHTGITATLNAGLLLAKGEWIARQDDDDWSDLARLQRQIEFVRENPNIILLGTSAWTHQQSGRPLWPVSMPQSHAEICGAFHQRRPFIHGSTLFRRSAALSLGGYRREFLSAQDLDFFWRMTEVGESANLAEPLYHYRYRGDSVSGQRANEQRIAAGAAHILAEARRNGQPEAVEEALREAADPLACGDAESAALKQADHLMLAGCYRQAWRAYSAILRGSRGNPLVWGKLARLGIFRFVPPVRSLCFR